MSDSFTAALWLNAVMMLCAVSLFAVPVMAPAIADDLGLDTTLVGAYMAIIWTASLASSVSAGHLIARFGAVRVSQFCLALCALGLGFTGTGSILLLALAAIVIGLGHGAETPSSSYLLAKVTPPAQQPFIFSVKQTGVQIGGMLAGFGYPVLLPYTGWRGAVLIVMLAVAAYALVLQRPRRHFDSRYAVSASASGGTIVQALSLVLRDAVLLRIGLASLAFVAVQISLNAFLVSFLVKERLVTLFLAGAILAAAQFGGLIGRLLWGAVSGRWLGATPLLALLGLAMMGCSAATGLYGTQMPTWSLVALMTVFGLTASGWNGVFLAEVARLAPREEVARVTGAIFVIGTVGIILGPLAFSAVAARWSFADAFVMAGAWALGGTLCLAWPRRPR